MAVTVEKVSVRGAALGAGEAALGAGGAALGAGGAALGAGGAALGAGEAALGAGGAALPMRSIMASCSVLNLLYFLRESAVKSRAS
jgi:hypothetical protein